MKTKMPPLVTITGPGIPHNYLDPLKQQACRGRSVLFYDQVGVGESDHPDATQAPWLYGPKAIDYFSEELEELIRHMNFTSYI